MDFIAGEFPFTLISAKLEKAYNIVWLWQLKVICNIINSRK